MTINDFERIAKEQPHTSAMWVMLTSRKRCIWCSCRFLEGLIRPLPKNTSVGIMDRFRGEFLFHAQSTHGFGPEDIAGMIENTLERDIKSLYRHVADEEDIHVEKSE